MIGSFRLTLTDRDETYEITMPNVSELIQKGVLSRGAGAL